MHMCVRENPPTSVKLSSLSSFSLRNCRQYLQAIILGLLINISMLPYNEYDFFFQKWWKRQSKRRVFKKAKNLITLNNQYRNIRIFK